MYLSIDYGFTTACSVLQQTSHTHAVSTTHAPTQLSHRLSLQLNVPPPSRSANSVTALRTQASHALAVPLIDRGSGRSLTARRNATPTASEMSVSFLRVIDL